MLEIVGAIIIAWLAIKLLKALDNLLGSWLIGK